MSDYQVSHILEITHVLFVQNYPDWQVSWIWTGAAYDETGDTSKWQSFIQTGDRENYCSAGELH